MHKAKATGGTSGGGGGRAGVEHLVKNLFLTRALQNWGARSDTNSFHYVDPAVSTGLTWDQAARGSTRWKLVVCFFRRGTFFELNPARIETVCVGSDGGL
jgi:hypothetical protein